MSKSAQFSPNQTMFVPVTELVEVPLLSTLEKAELMASLDTAQAEITAGRFKNYQDGDFLKDYLEYRTEKLS